MERYEEIERSLIKTYRKNIYSKFIKGIKEYDLVKENDHICVCISGGKDSMLLAKLMQELHKYSPIHFEVSYLIMNPGYSKETFNQIQDNLKILNIPAKIVNTDIFEIANNQASGGCYLCAKMRRGALYRIAKDMGCNKIALGHHYDDVIETTLMNLLNAGSFQTMLPKLHSTNYEGMELIRPLYFVREIDIIRWANFNNLKFIQCACKFTSKELQNDSQRYQTKKLIKELLSYNKFVEKNIFISASNVNVDKILGYKINDKKISFLDNYDKIKE